MLSSFLQADGPWGGGGGWNIKTSFCGCIYLLNLCRALMVTGGDPKDKHTSFQSKTTGFIRRGIKVQERKGWGKERREKKGQEFRNRPLSEIFLYTSRKLLSES